MSFKKIILSVCGLVFLFSSPVFAEGDLKAQLQEVLGGKESWKPKLLAALSRDMTCDQVKEKISAFEGCDPSKKYDFKEFKWEGNDLVSSVELTFEEGKLKDAMIKFKTNVDKDSFKAASLEIFETKWGAVKPEKKDQDLLTKIGPNFVKAQRTFIGGQWRIATGFPGTE